MQNSHQWAFFRWQRQMTECGGMNRTVDGILRPAFERGGRRRCPQLPQRLLWKWPRAPELPSYNRNPGA